MKYKDCDTQNPMIKVHITQKEQKDGTTVLRGYAIDAETGIKVDGAPILKRVAKNSGAIPVTEQQLVLAVMARLPKRERSTGRTMAKITDSAEIYKIIDSIIAQNEAIINQPNWAVRTQNHVLGHLRKHIIPLVMRCGDDIASSDIMDLYNELVEMATADPRYRGNRARTESSIAAVLRMDDTAYRYLREE